MIVVLLRHTEVEEAYQNRLRGRQDVALSAEGKKHADRIAAYLNQNYAFEKIYSSPLSRSYDLAKRVADSSGQKIKIDERLLEFDFGEWEGKTVEEVFENNSDSDLFYPPGGETIQDLKRRVESFWNEEILKNHCETVLVAAHGGVNRMLLLPLLGKPLEEFWDLSQNYGCLNEIQVDSPKEIMILRLNAMV